MEQFMAMAMTGLNGYMKLTAFNTAIHQGVPLVGVLLGGVAKSLDAKGDNDYVTVVQKLQGLGLQQEAVDYLTTKTGIQCTSVASQQAAVTP